MVRGFFAMSRKNLAAYSERIFKMARTKFVTISEVTMDDKVIPLTTNPCDRKIYTVTDLHPAKVQGEYRTVAVTLWDGFREHTSRISTFILVERRWN